MDHVDKIVKQWQSERADLSLGSMATIGRVKRLNAIFSRAMEKNFARFGLNGASFDVLATLRRSGKPYALSPGDLMAATMVTSGTMTNRIDQLEKVQLITRTPSDIDKRSVLISLTKEGIDLIDKAVDEHVKLQAELADCLSASEEQQFNSIMRKMLIYFENN